jgi:hypothetical protein
MVAAKTDDLGALVLKLPLIVRAPPGFLGMPVSGTLTLT